MERELKSASMAVKVTPSLKAQYQAVAESLGIDLSACISMALVQWLNTQKLTQAVTESVMKTLSTPEGMDMMLSHMEKDALPDIQMSLPLSSEEE